MRFIATTSVDARVCFKRTGKPLFYYVDSDFLPNYGTSYDNRRSTTGYCSYLAGACVSHCSRRQTTIATSTAHAEYLAAFECGREAIRIRVLLKDMGLPQLGATTIFEKTTKLASECRKRNRRLRVLSTLMCDITGYERP